MPLDRRWRKERLDCCFRKVLRDFCGVACDHRNGDEGDNNNNNNNNRFFFFWWWWWWWWCIYHYNNYDKIHADNDTARRSHRGSFVVRKAKVVEDFRKTSTLPTPQLQSRGERRQQRQQQQQYR